MIFSEYSYSHRDRIPVRPGVVFGWAFTVWTVVLIATVLICAGTISSQGRGKSEHPGPIPEKVIRLDGDSYVIQTSAVGPQDICWGDHSQGNNPVQSVTNVPSLDGTFVDCTSNQSWNNREGKSPTYWQGIMRTFKDIRWYAPMGIAMGLILLLTLIQSIPFASEWNHDRKKRPLDMEQKRKELVKGYAEGTIDDLAFSQAMDKLYEEGLPRAT